MQPPGPERTREGATHGDGDLDVRHALRGDGTGVPEASAGACVVRGATRNVAPGAGGAVAARVT